MDDWWAPALALYVGCGVLWSSLQAKSAFARGAARRAYRDGRLWVFAAGWAIGIMLWPLGPLGVAAFHLSVLLRRGRGRV